MGRKPSRYTFLNEQLLAVSYSSQLMLDNDVVILKSVGASGLNTYIDKI